MNRNRLGRAATRNALMGGMSMLLCWPMVAAAQEAPRTPEATAAGDAASGSDAEIVVTGSRIARSQFESPSPVTVTSEEMIEKSGQGAIFDILTQSPQFGRGISPTSGNGNPYNAESGGFFLNLRGLGTSRTLVLVNGQRRVSGSSTFSGVDLSSVPPELIARTEVVTGGAAAIYGADAVSGVVNVILKDDLDGLELSARQGISSRGDAHSWSVNATLGGPIGDRGRFVVGVAYSHDDPLAQSDRANPSYFFRPNPANTGGNDGIPNQILYPDVRFRGIPFSGRFGIGAEQYIYDAGLLRPLRSDILTDGPDGFFGVGGDGWKVSSLDPLRTGVSVLSALTHVEYDVTDGIRFFGDVQFARTRGNALLQPNLTIAPITRDNPYIPASVGALMDAEGQPFLLMWRDDLDQGRNERNVERTTYTIVAGLEGELAPSLNWKLFGQYGHFQNNDEFLNERIVARYAEAIDVVAGPDGPMCRSAAARAAGCLPINLFGSNVFDPAAATYVRADALTVTTNTQSVVGAQLSGRIFDLPAGPVSASLGVEYREETTRVRVDPLSAQPGVLVYGHGSNIEGRYDVKEAFGEISVPLFRDQPFASEFSIDGAARISDYSTIGSTFTWKVGGVYAPVPDIRFRVTRSRSVRAPNLTELFSPGNSTNFFPTDPCDAGQINNNPNRAANCAALGIPVGYIDPGGGVRQLVTGGNPGLDPEKSDSLTLGLVLQPSFLRGFNLSVDYFDIKIEDAIATVPAASIINGCVDSVGLTTELCNLVTRRADGAITQVNATPVNFAGLRAKGIDLAASYSAPLGTIAGEASRLSFSFSGSYALELEELPSQADPATVIIRDGTDDLPRFRSSLATTLDIGRVSATWTARYVSGSRFNYDVLPAADEAADITRVPSRFYNDLYLRFDVNDRFALGAGVNNLFDVDLTYVPVGPRAFHDIYGRYFFATAKLKL